MVKPVGGRDVVMISGRWAELVMEDVEEPEGTNGKAGGVSYRDGPDCRRI